MLSRPFLSLFGQNFCVLVALNIFNVLPDHFAAIGASKAYIGLYMNINSLVLMMLAVPLSAYADRIGKKRLVLWSAAGSLLSFSLSLFFLQELGILLVLRLLASLQFCVAFSVQYAEAFGHLPRDRRYSGMAIYGISGLAANPLGSFIGERLLADCGARWLFVGAAVFIAAGIPAAAKHRYLEKTADDAPRTPFRALLGKKELRPLFLLTFVLGGAYAVFATFLVNLTRLRLGIPTITLFFFSFSAVAVLMRLFLGAPLERARPATLLGCCFSLIAVAFGLTFGLRNAAMLAPIGVVYGVGHSALYPLLSTLFVNSGGEADRLGLNNLFQATNTFGNIAAAVAMGLLADFADVPAVFLAMGAVCAAMAPYALTRMKRKA